MEKLESKRLKLPTVFYIKNKEEIKDLPIGIPFILGDSRYKENFIRMLEYEVLYQQAIKSGYPFNFKKILKDNGFLDIQDFEWERTYYIDIATEGLIEKSITEEFDEKTDVKTIAQYGTTAFSQYVKDSSVYVDIAKLKELNVFPVWLDKIEDSIATNIHNYAIFNPNMYNKKLEGMYGGLELTSPNRNLIIIDISGSIPRAVSSTCLTLSKYLTETFYADLLITGSKSTLYPYEELHKLNIETIYEENGMDNDQCWFKRLVTTDKKAYKTAIVFGDYHSPSMSWNNSMAFEKTKDISREDGKKICIWEVDKVISFHTTSNSNIAGYAEWFSPSEVEYISDWVKDLNK